MPSRPTHKLFLSILLVAIISGFGYYLYLEKTYSNLISNPIDTESESRINFSVERNEPPKQIGKRLFEENIISSDWAFYKYVKENGIGPSLQAGKFILKRSYSIPEIVEFLTNARSEEITLTIKEGLTIQQVDKLLATENLLAEGEFQTCATECTFENYFFLDARPKGVESLEGYLFADTYFVDPDTITARRLIVRMLDNFQNKFDISGLHSKIAESGKSIHNVVTMASMIEKESRKKGEKAIISGILWKRNTEGIHLGVDATIRYAVGKWTEPLTIVDLKIESPFNTRTNAGLPPHPISNFSLSSLEAAVLPEESEYYYYLHSEEGQIHYANTNDDHNRNKQKYL